MTQHSAKVSSHQRSLGTPLTDQRKPTMPPPSVLTSAAAIRQLMWHYKKTSKNKYVNTDGDFLTAGSKGRVHKVKKCLRKKCGEFTIHSALDIAATNNHLQVVKELIPWVFTLCGSRHLCRQTIPEEGEVTSWPSGNGYTTLQKLELVVAAAAAKGNIDIIEYLLEVSYGLIVNVTSPMEKALDGGHSGAIHLMLTYDTLYDFDRVLEKAAALGNNEIVSTSLDKGNSKAIARAAHAALTGGHDEVAKLLLSRCNLDDLGPCVVMAAERNQRRTAEILLNAWDERPLTDPVKTRYTTSAVIAAILKGNVEMTKLLADKTDNHAVDNALKVAVQKKNVAMAMILVKLCSPDVILHEAVQAATLGPHRIVKVLLKKCEPVAVVAVVGDMVANDNVETAKLMLDNCAKHQIDALLEEAATCGNAKLVGLIKEKQIV